jgi:putative endonuclease
VEVKCYYVYIVARKKNGTLYIGVTSDLRQRVYQHKCGMVPGFTRHYGVHRLVYFETFCRIGDALTAEKRLKKWNRRWKIRLIEEHNPEWKDLCEDQAQQNGFPPARE